MAKIYENPEDVLRDQLAKKQASDHAVRAVAGLNSIFMGLISIERTIDTVASEGKPNMFSAALAGAAGVVSLFSAALWKRGGDKIKKTDEKQKALGPEEVVYPGAQPQASEPVQAAAAELLQSHFSANKSFADRVTPNPEDVATEHAR